MEEVFFKIATKENIKAVEEIWNNPQVANNPTVNQGFEIRKELYKHSLLFVSLNPGGRTDDKHRKLVLDIYNNQYTTLEDKVVRFEEKEKNPEKFFKPFKEICDYCNLGIGEDKKKIHFSHIDLLFINEISQTNLKDELAKGLKDFQEQQLMLSLKWIEELQPRAIIFSNSMARDIFLKYFEFRTDENDPLNQGKKKMNKLEKTSKKGEIRGRISFDYECGIYLLNYENDGAKSTDIPILFSRPLSGTGALDTGSYGRLKWQIRKILEKY